MSQLRAHANTDNKAPETWYAEYTNRAFVGKVSGDPYHNTISPMWILLYPDDNDLITAHPRLPGNLPDDECVALVAQARAVWFTACGAHRYREMAILAHRDCDVVAVEDALEKAGYTERQYGDDSTTRALREQLLSDEDD